jgi:FkbM family methyltransferase
MNKTVLFGAGNLGRKVLRILRNAGAPPLAFCDNDTSLWGKIVEGLPVYSPQEAVALFTDSLFIVTIWRVSRTEGIFDRVSQLKELRCERIETFINVMWQYPDQFLPDFFWSTHDTFTAAQKEIDRAYEVFDDFGKAEFLRQVRFRTVGDVSGVARIEGEDYFNNSIFDLSDDEFVVDCGAFHGDTLIEFLRASSGKFRRYLALEPDPHNFAQLMNICGKDERIECKPYAVGARRETLAFSSAGVGSAISTTGEHLVQCTTLDHLLEGQQPTYIKMDIEGSEPDALLGGKRLIQECRPKLAVCIYHSPEHLWSIPLLLRELLPESRITMRPHLVDGWDCVCYCVPE